MCSALALSYAFGRKPAGLNAVSAVFVHVLPSTASMFTMASIARFTQEMIEVLDPDYIVWPRKGGHLRPALIFRHACGCVHPTIVPCNLWIVDLMTGLLVVENLAIFPAGRLLVSSTSSPTTTTWSLA